MNESTNKLKDLKIVVTLAAERGLLSIELYDAIPKYFLGNSSKPVDAEPVERSFMFGGETHTVTIFPAKVKDKNGVYKNRLPGEREKIIHNLLRKMSTSQSHVRFLLDDTAGIVFTLYQLRKELKRTGHVCSLEQISEALEVCNQTNMIIKTADGKINGVSFFGHMETYTKKRMFAVKNGEL